jgi:hypothetical protein
VVNIHTVSFDFKRLRVLHLCSYIEEDLWVLFFEGCLRPSDLSASNIRKLVDNELRMERNRRVVISL